MAYSAVTTALCNVPFLVKKFVVTPDGATGSVSHGESVAPAVAYVNISNSAPGGKSASVSSVSSSVINLGRESAGNEAFEVYAFWFTQNGGGTTPV